MSASLASPDASGLAGAEKASLATAAANPRATALALLGVDAVVLLAGTVLGVHLWGLVNPAVSLDQYFDLGVSLALYVTVYWAFGLYAPAALGVIEELRRVVLATLLVSLVFAAAVFLTKEAARYSRGALLTSGALISVFVPLARAALRRACAARRWWGAPALMLGAGRTGRLLARKLLAEPGLALKPVACLDDDPEKQGDCAGVPVPGPLSLAPEFARRFGVRHLIVAMPGIGRERLLEIIERHGRGFARIIVVPNLLGIASLWVSTHDLGGVLGLEVRQNLLAPVNRAVKRTIDLVLAGALGLLALPVILISTAAIRLVSPGPVFFLQLRRGKNGLPLRVWKLRTMYPDSQRLLERHLAASESAREEWKRSFKLRDDPRVLPVIGRFLRRTSLDELPQLWSVLTGKMSLVGPRPFPSYHLDEFPPEFRALRERVRPGLTGLWQVTSRAEGDLAEQQELDTYYIRNWSLWLELHILARTAEVVLSGRGAY